MTYYGLTEPKKLAGGNILYIAKAEYDILFETFIQMEARPTLQGQKIFINNELIDGMHERFLHCISLEDKQYYNGILPCTNTEDILNCTTQCSIANATHIFHNLDRVECLYRLGRVQWIPQIIKYANNNSPNIRIWRTEYRDRSKGKYMWKRKVRYKNGLADFIIIFNEVYDKSDKSKLNYLDFRTAFPIFLRQDANDLDKEYAKYIKSKK
jgi:hypothetical protein